MKTLERDTITLAVAPPWETAHETDNTVGYYLLAPAE